MSQTTSQVPFVDMKTQYKALKEGLDAAILKVLESGAYVNGPEVAECERQLAAHSGTKFALTCASGTDALLMPLMALGIGCGDEVITSAFSFIATAETIVLAGATPVYVDIDPETYNLDPVLVEKAITRRTKAIMPVSLYGQIYDVAAINAIAKKHGIPVIEDAAQSYGASQNGQKSCSVSEFGATSFYPTKPLGCYGDGGAILTNSESHYKILKEIRDHGSESKYYHTRLGLNGRLDTIQCAVLIHKLKRFDWEMEQRQIVAKRYDEGLMGISAPGFRKPVIRPGNVSAWAQYTLEVQDRTQFQKRMTELGVPTMVHYPRIMPDQPWYKTQLMHKNADWTRARLAAERVVSLPFFPDMTAEQQKIVVDAVRKSI